MVRSSTRKGSMRNSILFLLVFFLIPHTFLWLYKSPIDLEKGVEVVRSMGYQLDGNSTWSEYADGGYRVIEKDLDGFLRACERIGSDNCGLNVHSDLYAKVMFVFDPPNNPGERILIFCRFR